MKNRWPLVFILLIGIITPLASTMLYYFSPPTKHTATGDILQPLPLPETWNVRGKWTLLYASDDACGESCRRRLCQTRQLRLMLPGHYFRLQRVWLRPPGKTPPQTVQVSADCGEKRAKDLASNARQVNAVAEVRIIYGALNMLPPAADGLHKTDYLYLADPDGNLAMRFPPALDAYQIRKDLSRLLKLSKGRKQFTK